MCHLKGGIEPACPNQKLTRGSRGCSKRCTLITAHMARSSPFENYHRRYERWFAHHQGAYHSELLAMRALLPWQGLGLEIGVGSGRFASPLGVQIGLDPSHTMLRYASERRIHAVQGVAESLPFPDATFDYVLVVTTICFVDDPVRMLSEAWRVLRPHGSVCIGFIDHESFFGSNVSRAATTGPLLSRGYILLCGGGSAPLEKGWFRRACLHPDAI